MSSPFVRYALPALLVGSLAGYFVGNTGVRPAGNEPKKPNLRERFLGSEDEFDYEKLARVCMTAASRTARAGRGSSTLSNAAIIADSNDPEVLKAKARLDEVLSKSLEMGTWSRGAGVVSRGQLKRLPPSDVADFERLLRTTLDSGELEVQPGAWVPEVIN